MKIGGNVALATLLMFGIVGVVQTIAYSVPGARFDMTSSRINSLGPATEKLLTGLDKPITLTSLYFETDIEDKDQQLYRRTVKDLLNLYQSTARSKVTADFINPLSDHERLAKFHDRLRKKPKFAEEIKPYKERLERYTGELDARIRTLLQSEAKSVSDLTTAPNAKDAEAAVGQIQTLLQQWAQETQETRDRIDALTALDDAQYAGATGVLKTLYRDLIKSLQDIANFSKAQLARNGNLPAPVADFLSGAGSRYAELVGELEGESTKLNALEPLTFDELTQKLQPNANAIVVETDDDALVVEFSDMWPPLDQNRPGSVKFKDRAFKGEEKLTSAILRATHKEQTAVIFVRYGGMAQVGGPIIPGQAPAPYATMKKQLEDTNFVVDEWDLKSSDTPPTIEPAPTRTIYVVLQPASPQPGPMGQPSQEPPFTDAHRQMILSKLGDNARAIFIAGWYPGPFGAMPAKYEYGEYLKKTWGIDVDTSELLIETVNFEPGKYAPPRNTAQLFGMSDLEVGNHIIMSGAQARLVMLPFCAPLVLTDPAPEGVTRETLLTVPPRDTAWGVKNLQAYQQQLQDNGFMVRADGDVLGPFTLAVAASKGDAKIVVVSSRSFAVDDVAFARQLAFTAQGVTVRSSNPGNVTLFINSLHWLNDNTSFMNIGKPIDAAVLEIKNESTRRWIQALTIFVWPALALAFGGVAWWTRRR